MAVSTLTRRRLQRVVGFALVGVVNTLIDVVLFWALCAPLGIVVANVVSTSAGMTFSFQMNGRHTFGAERVTLRQAALFLASNALTMWVLQPALILTLYDANAVPLMLAKTVALGGSVVADFLLYRYLVWPDRASRQAFDAALRSRRSSGGSAKMSDSSALCTASASGKPRSAR